MIDWAPSEIFDNMSKFIRQIQAQTEVHPAEREDFQLKAIFWSLLMTENCPMTQVLMYVFTNPTMFSIFEKMKKKY